MAASRLLPSRYLMHVLGLALILPVAGTAEARALLPGETATVVAEDTPEDWSMAAGATLNINGGQVLRITNGGSAGTVNINAGGSAQQVNIDTGSVLNISGGAINSATSSTPALLMTSSAATISSNSTVTSVNGIGISAAQLAEGPGSRVVVDSSTISGGSGGITLSADSTLNVTGSTVTGTGANSYGIRGFSSDMTLRSSTVTGTSNGVLYRVNAAAVREGTVTIDGSHIEGGSGAAIRIDGSGTPMVANFNITNGTTLTGGNGNALEIANSATANVLLQDSDVRGDINVSNNSASTLTFDHAGLTGNVSADPSSNAVLALNNGSVLTGNVSDVDSVNLNASSMTGNITSSDGTGVVSLQNNSVFTGNLINVDRLTVGDPSIWNMVSSNSVNTLVMDTGVVKFGAANEFFQLDDGNLSGSGTFVMDVDYATNQHDTLNITGSATGSHTLLVEGSGVDPVSPEQLTLVHTGGGDAKFALAGGVVDAGTFSYALGSVANGSGGTDWFLDPSTATISPGTASVLALFNTAPTVWYGELTSLRTRMGELRFNGGKAGGWMRAYGNKYNVDEASGLGYKQTQQGFSLGADAPLPFGDGQWLIGVLAGHSTSDLNLSRGTTGTVKSYYVGAYTTWLDQDSGYYFDGVLKFNRFNNDSKVSMSDGTRAKGDYANLGMGGSVEFGRHIKLNDGYFVEPFTQVSAVVIQGKDYGLNNGMEAEGDRTRSLLGKVGVTAGRNFTLSDGKVVQPYVRVAGVHEFAKNNDVQVNNNVFNNDLSGSRGELGAGVAVSFNENLQAHADFDYSNGEHIEQPFGANVGLRYSW